MQECTCDVKQVAYPVLPLGWMPRQAAVMMPEFLYPKSQGTAPCIISLSSIITLCVGVTLILGMKQQKLGGSVPNVPANRWQTSDLKPGSWILLSLASCMLCNGCQLWVHIEISGRADKMLMPGSTSDIQR